MKKYITYLLATALVGSAFVSCSERLQEGEMRISTHKVHFSASDAETRTGLSIDGTTVTPDWNKTAVESIHLFEIDANDAVAYGETIAITTSEDKATAHFEADFPTDMSIIVDPSGTEEGGGTKGATKGTRVSPYKYAAIIAQKPDKNNFTFVVPGEQHPDAETLKDPDADFLIGYSRKAYDTEHFFDEPVVDLYFDRVAALGRLAISNFAEGEKVQSVTINAQNGLTGSASYADIDFENGSVSFVREEGPGAITLIYDGGMDIPADGPFYAYFVAIPGSATLTSVEVVTNQYHYTKTIEGGKELTFSEKAFKSMNLDLSTATREEVAPSGLTWYKASVLEDGIDYLIVSQGQALKNNDGATAAVSVTDNEGVITLEAADPTIVWTATAKTYTTGDNGEGGIVAGHFTLTNNGYYLRRQSNTDILLDTTIPSDKPKYVVWDYDGSYLKHESSETATFFCFYNNGWSTGYTSNGAAPGSDIKTVQIYTSRAPQELAFTPAASAEYDLATSEWVVAVPTLSGAKTSVTYALSEDSNPAVATVDADGTVHPLSRGTVTIVATAAGNDQYQAASASYTLRVVDSSVTTNTYIKVTSTSDLEVGAKYLLVFEGLAGDTDGDGNPKVFKPILDGNTFSKATSNALDVEIESGTISSSEFEGSHLTLESGYYLKVDAVNRYLYPTGSSGGSGTLSAEATATNKLTITFNNGIAQIKVNSGSNYLVWSTSSHYFSSNAQVSGDYSTGICLYKLDDGRLPQTLSFSPTSATYDLYSPASFNKPTLSTAYGTVTYSSSDEAIATVDNSGNITGKKKGTVTITATAAGDSQYKSGSASYVLTVENSDPSAPTDPVYTKVMSSSDLVLGGKYLIVNSDATKVFKPALNGSNFDATSANAIAEGFTVEGNTIVSSELDACQVVINTLSSGYSIYVPATSTYWYLTSGNMGSESSAGTSHYSSITVDNGSVTIKRGSSNYYMRYSTNNNYFYESSTSSTVTLYRLDDGSNPGGGDDPGDDPGEEKYYVLVTSEPASWDGTYLIVNTASDGSGSAMNGTSTASVTISEGKIRSTSTIDGYALTVTSAGEVHPNQTDSNQGLIAYDIKFNDGNWLYWYSNKYKQTSEDQSSRHNKCTLYYDNGGVRIMSAGYNVNLNGEQLSSTPSKNYLYYSSSSFTMSSSHSSDRVQLYKLENP